MMEDMRTWDDDNLLRDAPFFATACLLHAVFIAAFPGWRWSGAPAASPSLPVEFVSEVPKLPEPTPALAPIPQNPGPVTERPAAAGPAAAPAEKPKAIKHHARRPAMSAAQKTALIERRAEARRQANALAAARAETQRLRAEQARAEKLAQEQAAAAAAAVRQQKMAAAKAARARQKLEVSQQLAAMVDPDEKLSDAVADPGLAGGAMLAGAGGEAAALNDAGSAVYDVEREGYDPAPSGAGGGGGGLSWSIEGPIGNRRIMRRSLPKSPAWVAKRGLELAVQIKFQVMPDGSVKAGSVIQKTSGFPELDSRALDSIRKWRFEAIAPRPGLPEIWGRVTFRFLMS